MPVCLAHYPGDEIACTVDVTAINCAVILDHDVEIGDISTIDPSQSCKPILLPSQRIDVEKLAHLTLSQSASFSYIIYTQKLKINALGFSLTRV